MGVEQGIARDIGDYVRLAVALGRDRSFRDEVTAQLREQSGRVFQDQQAVEEHERIFRELVSRGNAS
jgi:predicted O-linked N-acetylglucosamine transferase (SPINDLY family)